MICYADGTTVASTGKRHVVLIGTAKEILGKLEKL
jgi:hypothetical protein